MKPPNEENDESADAARKAMSTNINALSRALAVVLIMLIPVAIGHFLDRWLGQKFWIVLGFLIGMIMAIVGLIFVVKQAEAEMKKKRDSS